MFLICSVLADQSAFESIQGGQNARLANLKK